METVLEAIGVTAVDWNYKTRCCGASSVIYNPECALDLMARIMGDAVSRGAGCLVVNCPMCQMNMESQQDQFCEKHGIKERLPVYFITELVGLALGLSKEDLQPGDDLFISGMDWEQLCGDSV
jgi:heterodisulfide reductase subunit B